MHVYDWSHTFDHVNSSSKVFCLRAKSIAKSEWTRFFVIMYTHFE